jgi:hypothetical protein
MHITVLLNVWNSALWLPWTLRGCYDFADTIVVTESCWVDGYWVGETSPDGTADIVRNFMRGEDHARKVRFHQAGRVPSQQEGRNSGLPLVPAHTDWAFLIDSDEFFMPGDLALVRAVLPEITADHVIFPARSFYFDLTWYKPESFHRGWRWYSGQHFEHLGALVSRNGESVSMAGIGLEMFHYSYVSPEWTRLKGCIGDDVAPSEYERWRREVFAQFNGENLQELYARNGGGVHVYGGGALQRYEGPHPPVLDDHPLRHWRWSSRCDSPAGKSADSLELCGIRLDKIVGAEQRLRSVVERITQHIEHGRLPLAGRMVQRELGHLPVAAEILNRLAVAASRASD